MPEYISREALLRTLSKEVGYNDDGDQDINSDTVFIAIESAPASDVETVRHGKPVYKNRPEHYDTYSEVRLYDGEVLYKREHHIAEENPVSYCPECGERLCTRFTNYCPNCGAKMNMEEK